MYNAYAALGDQLCVVTAANSPHKMSNRPNFIPISNFHFSMKHLTYFTVLLTCFLHCISPSNAIADVVFAVNCGGPAHRDVYGVEYESDPLEVGVASDFGKSLSVIGRVPPQDAILYQTERYDVNTFGYTTAIEEDGDYVLVLKFCEVWFAASRQKVCETWGSWLEWKNIFITTNYKLYRGVYM